MRPRISRLTLVVWLAVALLSLIPGCAHNSLRGPGFSDSDWAQKVRPADPTSKGLWGFSTKARQIESNLGVH